MKLYRHGHRDPQTRSAVQGLSHRSGSGFLSGWPGNRAALTCLFWLNSDTHGTGSAVRTADDPDELAGAPDPVLQLEEPEDGIFEGNAGHGGEVRNEQADLERQKHD